MSEIQKQMHQIGQKAKAAAKAVAQSSTKMRNYALIAAAESLHAHKAEILNENQKDVHAAQTKGLSAALIDRLMLNESRIEAMAQGLEMISALADPVGAIMDEWDRPNGLKIQRVRVPLGVIGVIFESRPNVTADAGALCLKSGNTVVLRGGSDSIHSAKIIVQCLHEGLVKAGLPIDAIQLIETTDRQAVAEMLKMNEYIDVIVPRGGRGLIERIQNESKIPLFMHLEGLNNTYIDAKADKQKAIDISVNAKMRRTGICGATENLVLHQDIAHEFLPAIAQELLAKGCEIRGDTEVQALIKEAKAATEQDWDTEYLDAIIAVKIVKDINAAINFVSQHNSQHTDAIITEDEVAATQFLNEVDSAIVVWNASTQFADGGEFGMGAEIGISTGRMHARGPVGLEQLTTFKYKVYGSGQTRP